MVMIDDELPTPVCDDSKHLFGFHIDTGDDYCDMCGVHYSDYENGGN